MDKSADGDQGEFKVREVSPVISLRIVQYHHSGHMEPPSQPLTYILSIRNPGDEILEGLKEGDRLLAFALNANRRINHVLHLSSSSKTVFKVMKLNDEDKLRCFDPRSAIPFSSLLLSASGIEVDFVAMVVFVRPKPSPSFFPSTVSEVVFCDMLQHICVLEVSKVEADAARDLFQPGQVLAVVNVTFRLRDIRHCACRCEAGEHTQFLRSPRAKYLQEPLAALNRMPAADRQVQVAASIRVLENDSIDFVQELDVPEPVELARPASAEIFAPKPIFASKPFKPPTRVTTPPIITIPATTLNANVPPSITEPTETMAPQPIIQPTSLSNSLQQPQTPKKEVKVDELFENFTSPYASMTPSPRLKRDFKKPTPTRATLRVRIVAPSQIVTHVKVAAGDLEKEPRVLVLDLTEGVDFTAHAADHLVECPMCGLSMTEIECIVHSEACGSEQVRRNSLRRRPSKRSASPLRTSQSRVKKIRPAGDTDFCGSQELSQRASQVTVGACCQHLRHATEDLRRSSENSDIHVRMRIVVTDGRIQKTVQLEHERTQQLLEAVVDSSQELQDYLEHFRASGSMILEGEGSQSQEHYLSQFSSASQTLPGRKMLLESRLQVLKAVQGASRFDLLKMLLARLVIVDMRDAVEFIAVWFL